MDPLPPGTNLRTIRKWLNDLLRLATRPLRGVGTHSSEDGHAIIPLTGQEVLLYELTTSFAVDGTTKQWIARGKPVVRHPSKLWAVNTNAQAEIIELPAGFQNGSDQSFGMMPYGAGQRIYVTDSQGTLECVSPPLDRWRIELKDALEPFGTATCHLLPYVEGSLQIDTGIEVEATDFLGLRGRAYKDGTPPVLGSRGWIQYCPDRNAWEFVSLQPHAQLVIGQADADWSGSDSVISIDSALVVLPTKEALWMDADGNEPVEFANDRHCTAGKDNDWVAAYWDDQEEEFYAFMGKLREQEVMTNFQVDTTNLKLQKKTRKVWAHITEDESNWTDIHTGDACP